jgi:hypothetical protein
MTRQTISLCPQESDSPLRIAAVGCHYYDNEWDTHYGKLGSRKFESHAFSIQRLSIQHARALTS